MGKTSMAKWVDCVRMSSFRWVGSYFDDLDECYRRWIVLEALQQKKSNGTLVD